MKILFDHNVPRKLRRSLLGHEVRTAREMGWDTLSNGNLLKAGEAQQFSVMITGDQSIYYQQNLTDRVIALIVLTVVDWNILQHHTQMIADSVERSRTSTFEVLHFPPATAKRPLSAKL